MLLCYVKLSASLVPLVPPSGALDRTRLRSFGSQRGAPREPKVFIRGTAAKIKDSSRCVNDRTRLRSKRYPSGRQRVRSKWVPSPFGVRRYPWYTLYSNVYCRSACDRDDRVCDRTVVPQSSRRAAQGRTRRAAREGGTACEAPE